MAAPLELRASALAGFPIDQLLGKVERAGDVTLRMDGRIDLDAVSVAMLIVALSKRERSVSVAFTARGRQASAIASLRESLLAPVLWGSEEPASLTASSGQLLGGDGAIADHEARTFIAPTGAFPLAARSAFQASLEKLCRRAGVLVPPTAYGAVSTVAFETASNAEEYGAFADIDGSTPSALRYLIGRLHTDVPRAVPPSVSAYLQDFEAAGHSLSTRWFELMVVDAGIGITYPSYYLLASGNGWPTKSVYEMPGADERARLNLILNTRESTKGQWGRIVNQETARGEGTRAVMIRLSSVRGYVAAYSGRSRAEWWYSRTTRSHIDVAGFPPYEVLENIPTPFVGTIWHVLVPLDAQLTLNLAE